MQVMLWLSVYLLVIVALSIWREHRDAAQKKRRRIASPAVGGGAGRVRASLKALPGSLKHTHRTS